MSADTFIDRVAQDLRDRFTATEIRRDGQAVVLNFRGGAHSIDVVPATFERFEASRPIFLIPGADGEWIETSPERHDRAFKAACDRSGGKLRMISQLLKAWRFGRTPPIPLSSFYTDMLLASTDVGIGVKSYSECLSGFFTELLRRNARGLTDPEGVGGRILATTTTANRERLLSSANTARIHAYAALRAERNGDSAEAVRQWQIIFNRMW